MFPFVDGGDPETPGIADTEAGNQPALQQAVNGGRINPQMLQHFDNG